MDTVTSFGVKIHKTKSHQFYRLKYALLRKKKIMVYCQHYYFVDNISLDMFQAN